LAAFVKFRKLAASSDVLHFWFPWPFADLLYHLSGTDKPVVLTYVSDVVRQRLLGKAYAPLMWQTLKKMRVIVANCPAYARTSPILSHAEIAPKVRVIPLGIEESTYPKTGNETILARLGLEPGEPYFLFIGVLRYYKGAHFLVAAAQRLKARIVIAGSGPELEKLKTQVAQSGISNVIFAGQVTDAEKISLIMHCRALVLPSHLRSEAFGMVLVEAAMLGKPMISCEIGTGTSFVNAHEVTGLVVSPASSEALVAAMQILWKEDALASSMGQAARVRYETMFSGPVLGKAYSNVFHEVLD
jgi:rhamnosyl/mannosyltransferase